jgi:hypothetical protein
MEELSLRPVFSGIAGGLLAWWLTNRWSRWIPNRVGPKDADTLVAENRRRIQAANAIFFGLLLVGIGLFTSGYVARSDWRVFGLTIGVALVAPIAFLYLSTRHLGTVKVQEAFVAFAINQRMPLGVLFGVVALGFIALCASVVSLADV